MAMNDNASGGITPTFDLNRNYNNGLFGANDGGSWLMLLFMLLAWGNNGNNFGGFGNFGGNFGGYAPSFGSYPYSHIPNDFVYTNLDKSLGRIQDQNTYNANTLQQGMCSLGYDNLSQFKDLSAQMLKSDCDTNRNIDAIRYENAKNTSDIINAGHADTQRIIDTLTQIEVQDLRDKLRACELGLSQKSQTSDLIEALRPSPKPSYITYSPFTSVFPQPNYSVPYATNNSGYVGFGYNGYGQFV